MSKRKSTRPRRIRQSDLVRYVKAVAGRTNDHGQSLVEFVGQCLMLIDGIERPPGIGLRNFVEANRERIESIGKTQPKPVAVPTPPKLIVDPNRDGFLSSYAWRQLRMQALKLHGAKCQCCGASPSKNGIVLHVDHIKPRRKHPELALTLGNLQVLCEECNHGKGNWDQTDWREQAVP